MAAYNDNFLVRVACATYNHALYIVDALNGFVMQQTSFPFVCTIIDDASTDGAQGVIRKYLSENFDLQDTSVAFERETENCHTTFAQHKTNRNCFFAVIYLKENHYSQKKAKGQYIKEWLGTKYIAKCEGDDYWTDSQKLQKQVDFLETHPDYSLCCHRFKIYHERTGTWSDDYVGAAFAEKPDAEGLEVCNAENFRTRFTWPLTLCYRKSVVDNIVWYPYKLGRRDFTFHYHLLKAGKGWCMADYMGVYRMHDGGVWARKSSFEMDKFRLEGYEDFYSYHKDDYDVVSAYQYWLDLFFHKHVFPAFSRFRITFNGIKLLFFASKHALKVKGILRTVAKWIHCFMLVIGFERQ